MTVDFQQPVSQLETASLGQDTAGATTSMKKSVIKKTFLSHFAKNITVTNRLKNHFCTNRVHIFKLHLKPINGNASISVIWVILVADDKKPLSAVGRTTCLTMENHT